MSMCERRKTKIKGLKLPKTQKSYRPDLNGVKRISNLAYNTTFKIC